MKNECKLIRVSHDDGDGDSYITEMNQLVQNANPRTGRMT